MKNIIHKFIICAALLVGCLLPIVMQANGSRGHHHSGIIGQVVGLPTFIHHCHIRIVSSDGRKVDADIVTDSDLTFV